MSLPLSVIMSRDRYDGKPELNLFLYIQHKKAPPWPITFSKKTEKAFFLMSRAFLPHPPPPFHRCEPAHPHTCKCLSCSASYSNVYSAIKTQPIKGNSLGAPVTGERARAAGGVYKWLRCWREFEGQIPLLEDRSWVSSPVGVGGVGGASQKALMIHGSWLQNHMCVCC